MSRPTCYRCHRPASACLCARIKPVANQPEIIILQHPDEVRHAIGSAIIADLSLQRCVRHVGEDFSSDDRINRIIEQHGKDVFVVFPTRHAMSLSSFERHHALDEQALGRYRFVFIDASWRKARKMWHLSSNLHRLPAIELDGLGPSRYRIRKAPAPGLASTLEAIVTLLSRLESAPDKYRPLLEVFDDMIDHQIQRMGKSVYRRNYGP